MKRKTYPELTLDDMLNMWLVPFFGTTIEELSQKNEWKDETDSRRFYKTYAVTQEQHDQWYSWVIYAIFKERKWSIKRTKREFMFAYINCAPQIKK